MERIKDDGKLLDAGAIFALIGIAPLVLLLAAFPAYFAYNLIHFVIEAVLTGPTR